MFEQSIWPRRWDGGFGDWGIREGEIGDGEIEEGGPRARPAPLGVAMSPKRRARTRGQNPLVMLYLGPVNSVKKSAKSKNTVGGGGWCTLPFADFFIHIARGKHTKFPPAIVPIPVIFNNCSGGTHPVSSSIVKRSHRNCEDFGRDPPAICRPR
jgi:hypothetical protein